MSELQVYHLLLWSVLGLSVLVLISSLFVTAPYGRYARPRWSGPDLPSWLGWMLMEIPQPVGFVLCFALGERHRQPVALAYLGMWCFHYTYRTFTLAQTRSSGQHRHHRYGSRARRRGG